MTDAKQTGIRKALARANRSLQSRVCLCAVNNVCTREDEVGLDILLGEMETVSL